MRPIQDITGRLGNQMFEFAALYSYAKDNNVDFYFQDPKWFAKHEQDIKTMFGEGIGYLEQVSIHVRRGDYVGNKFYVQLWDTDYYDKAIAMFPTDSFLIFSDDPEWCKEKWGNNPRFQIMEKGDEIEDFNLMASCKHTIISNSSYSWWAGFLNPNYGKTVVYPGDWFNDKIERVKFPKTWTKI